MELKAVPINWRSTRMCDKAMKQSHRVGPIFFVRIFFLRGTSQIFIRTKTERWFYFMLFYFFSTGVKNIVLWVNRSVVYWSFKILSPKMNLIKLYRKYSNTKEMLKVIYSLTPRKNSCWVFDPCSISCCFSSGEKGLNRTRTLTSAMPVQCSSSRAIRPTGRWLFGFIDPHNA